MEDKQITEWEELDKGLPFIKLYPSDYEQGNFDYCLSRTHGSFSGCSFSQDCRRGFLIQESGFEHNWVGVYNQLNHGKKSPFESIEVIVEYGFMEGPFKPRHPINFSNFLKNKGIEHKVTCYYSGNQVTPEELASKIENSAIKCYRELVDSIRGL